MGSKFGDMADIRAEIAADALGIDPPGPVFDENGELSASTIEFCQKHNVSLDYVILGDIRPSLRLASLAAKAILGKDTGIGPSDVI